MMFHSSAIVLLERSQKGHGMTRAVMESLQHQCTPRERDHMRQCDAPGLFEGKHAANRTNGRSMETVRVLLDQPVELRRRLPECCYPIALCGPRTMLGILQRRQLQRRTQQVSEEHETRGWAQGGTYGLSSTWQQT